MPMPDICDTSSSLSNEPNSRFHSDKTSTELYLPANCRPNVVGDKLKAVGNDETDKVKDSFKNKTVGEGLRMVKEKLEKSKSGGK